MRRAWIVVAAVVMLAVAGAGVAGEKHERCKGSTQDCLDKMSTKLSNKAWLGVGYEPTDEGQWIITKVVEGSPAEQAGFRKGDVLIAMNGISYAKENTDEIKKAWSKVRPGSEVRYVVKRSSGKAELEATLGTMPPEMVAEYVGYHMIHEHATVKVASN
jgi:C-terminal processing protease CtpA/Prc